MSISVSQWSSLVSYQVVVVVSSIHGIVFDLSRPTPRKEVRNTNIHNTQHKITYLWWNERHRYLRCAPKRLHSRRQSPTVPSWPPTNCRGPSGLLRRGDFPSDWAQSAYAEAYHWGSSPSGGIASVGRQSPFPHPSTRAANPVGRRGDGPGNPPNRPRGHDASWQSYDWWGQRPVDVVTRVDR